jgi:HD-like signal output (HDOD) protein
MDDFFKTLIDKIPPLPESVTRIEAYAKDPNVSYKQVSQMLQKDPILTSEILKAANLPIYGFSKKINTLENALSLFGLGTIRGFVLAVYVRNNFTFTLEPYDISPQQFSFTASKHHAFASNWYFRSMPRLFDILSPATFLSNLGQMFISQYLIANNQKTDFNAALHTNTHAWEVEEKFCGISAVELTAEIFEHWGLEERLVNALRYITHPEDAPKRDAIYSQILRCIHTAIPYNSVMNEETLQEAATLVEAYQLDLEGFLKAVETA